VRVRPSLSSRRSRPTSWLRSTAQTTERQLTTWDARSYLNIWVCNTVPGLTGYATFPGSDRAVDGIVIRYDAFGTTGKVSAPFNLGRTLTHEVGHWMGLKQLWHLPWHL
jgi:hypothetical protein